MSGGDNISNIKAMYDRETRYIDGLGRIRKELKHIEDQPISFILPALHGLIDYIGDLLDE